MAIFAITFRIHQDATYTERYNSLIDQIKKESIDSADNWDEPTSFVLMQSRQTANDLCDALYIRSSISESKDVLVVVNLSEKTYAQKGAKYPNTLDWLMVRR
jgi:hypothetical protein